MLLVLVVGMMVCAQRSDADLKAVFAFNERVLSIRFPEFNYGIATTVADNARQIAITFPNPASEGGEGVPAPHLEISLEPIQSGVDGADYYQHYLNKYADEMGTTELAAENPAPAALSLLDCRMTMLSFRDTELRLHKALLVTSINQGTGVVILLDELAEKYDVNEKVTVLILQSIHFEN